MPPIAMSVQSHLYYIIYVQLEYCVKKLPYQTTHFYFAPSPKQTNKGSISLISLFSQIWPHLLEFSFFPPSNLVRLLHLDMRLSPICQSSFTDLSEPTTSGWIVKLVKVIGYHGFNLEHIQK